MKCIGKLIICVLIKVRKSSNSNTNKIGVNVSRGIGGNNKLKNNYNNSNIVYREEDREDNFS